jgi:hypothetical protein
MTHAPPSDADPLTAALDAVRHVLPDQGPIGVFVHHNPLHGLQHLPFHDAVAQAAPRRGARTYLDEADFRDALESGRIDRAELSAALPAEDGPLPLGLTVRALRLLALEHDLVVDDAAGLHHQLDTGTFVADPARWDECRLQTRGRPPRDLSGPPPRRHRDVLVALGAPDPDVTVHTELQRWCASFVDEGQALTPLPGRDKGLWRAVLEAYRDGASFPPGARGLRARLPALLGGSPEDAVLEALDALGVPPADRGGFVEATLLALAGWAGLFSRLERRPDEQHVDAPARLVEFLALRLVLERELVPAACRRAGLPAAWSELRAAPLPREVADEVQPAATLYLVARHAGADAHAVRSLAPADVDALFAALAAFPLPARHRVWQEAYEATYRRRVLDALAEARRTAVPPAAGRPKAAFVFCIDEREESIRRALEELDPLFHTYGAAGFFGVAIDYQGLDDAAPAAYCPAVVVPAHEVREEPVLSHRPLDRTRQRLRASWQSWQHQLTGGSRALGGGLVQSLLLGPVVGLRTAGHVLVPRSAQAFAGRVWDWLLPSPTTRLVSVRALPEARTDRGKWAGFSIEEQVERVASVLTNLGLLRDVRAHRRGPRPRLDEPQQPPRVGARLRRLRRPPGRRQRPAVRGDGQPPEVRAGLHARGLPCPPTPGSSARCTTPPTTPSGTTTSTRSRRRRTPRSTARTPPSRSRGARARRALPPLRRRPARTPRPRRRWPTSRPAPRPSRSRGPSTATAPTPSPSWAAGRSRAGCSSTAGRSSSVVRPDRRPRHPRAGADPRGGGPGGRRHQPRVLLLVGRQRGVRLRDQAPAQRHRARGGDERPRERPAHGAAAADGRAPRADAPAADRRGHAETLLAIAGRQAEVRELVVNRLGAAGLRPPETGAMHHFVDGAFTPVAPRDAPLPRVRHSVEWFRGHRDHLGPALVEAGRG